jgi:hypothetical protein
VKFANFIFAHTDAPVFSLGWRIHLHALTIRKAHCQ